MTRATMTGASRRAGLLLVTAVSGLFVAAALVVPAAPAAAGPADALYSLLNEERWANGQAGLLRNPAMDQVAADWAAQLAQEGGLRHNPKYSSQIPGGWTSAAENVAQGYPDPSAMHAGWMGSSGHRANILGDFTDVGIAFVSQNGSTWGVQVFASYPGHVGPPAPPPPPPPEPPPPPAAEAPPPDPQPAAESEPTASPTPDPSASPTPTPAPTQYALRAERAGSSGAPPFVSGLVISAVIVTLTAGAAVAVYLFRRRARRRTEHPPN